MDAPSLQSDVDTGLDRVKELEAMVKKLTHENQKLLTKVQEPRPVQKPPTSTFAERASNRDEDDLVPLSGSEGEDDEWWENYMKLPFLSLDFDPPIAINVLTVSECVHAMIRGATWFRETTIATSWPLSIIHKPYMLYLYLCTIIQLCP